ncbi:hypothetical protein SAMN05216199_1624 [Pedococcus cremeus]|uniref:Uncharacterized protein n=1 Tax=Pedococcus cremeus TaxID=587636 RepID=A0A1H9TIF9_9MICO|nr:hypothetical protein [Pedococcus cremeus]SER96807.1 hypothetical protein SAMN05216199_1624 [Pedococcus cremeus]
MAVGTRQEVYVVFEGVFTLDPGATTDNGWVTVRTPPGARVELPVEAVAEWDVDTPVRPDGRLSEVAAPFPRGIRW